MRRFLHKKTYRHLTDEELMQMVAEKGCEFAFNELYQRHAQRLMGFFYRMLRQDKERAADACQDTFMKIWRVRYQYNVSLAFRPWMFTIAYNMCRSYFRHNEVEEKCTTELYAMFDEASDDEMELYIDQETMLLALDKTLKKLSDEQRTLFALRYEEELTIPQVAQILSVPEGTVKSRLHRMLNFLKHELKKYEGI